MYVGIYRYVLVCMHVTMCVCMYVCMHVCMYNVCMYVGIVCYNVCIYVYMCICTYIFNKMYLTMYYCYFS